MASPATPVLQVEPETPPTSREDIQNKYDRLYGQQTPVATAPEPVAQPASETPAPAQTVSVPAEFLDAFKTIKDELTELKAGMIRPQQPSTPVPEVKLTPWFEQLREGNFEGAEQDLTNRVKDAVTLDAARKAVSEAVETMRVQMEIDKYVTKLRAEQPDLVAAERYLQAPVAARMETLKAQGKIKSGEDFVKAYQESVEAEVAEWRKVGQQYRAAGVEQARTSTQRVLGATPLQPQSITSTQDTNTQQTPQAETIEDYFARRKNEESLRKGLLAQ